MHPTEPDDSLSSTTRRRVLAAGASLAVGLAGCVTGQSDEESIESQLESVRSATADYADPATALEDGFRVSGPYVPGMGWHFVHPGRTEAIAEEGFSRSEPNILTYLERDDGLELAAVEYGSPAGAVPEEPDLFDDSGAEATEEWHVHESATHVFANADGEVNDPGEVPFEEWVNNDNWAEFHPPEDLEPGDAVSLDWGSTSGKEGDRTERVVDLAETHPSLRTLHAWVHVENPAGAFAPTHPDRGGEDGHEHDHEH